MKWDDRAPLEFLARLHLAHKRNQREWQKQHAKSAKHLVYADVDVALLDPISDKLKIKASKIEYWSTVINIGLPMGTLYVQQDNGRYRVLDGNHRLKILQATNEQKARVAYVVVVEKEGSLAASNQD